MFDLNLSIVSNGGGNFDGNNCDGWSGETSAANGEGESSSSNDDSAAFTFNLDASNNSDQGLTSTTEFALVTRDLFPVSRLDESDRVSQAAAPDHAHRQFIMPRVAVQEEVQQVQAVQARKSRRGPRSRSSQYRGVTFYRRTGRWESHIWDCGKQVYLGGFDTALAAARAYDRAAIKFRGVEADINFNLGDYEDMKQVMNLPKDEFVQMLRRQSNGFSRGGSKYKGGVALQREFLGKKYDKAAIMFNEETINGSSQHDLNLNLGMSASSPNKSGSLDSFKLHHDAQTRTKLMYLQQLQGGNSVSNFISNPTLEGVPVTSKHPILGNALDPKFVPNNEERERSGYLSQMEVANLAWRMNGQDRTTAASSRFSSPTLAPAPAPSGSASPVPFDFSSHSNALAFYSWMHPPSLVLMWMHACSNRELFSLRAFSFLPISFFLSKVERFFPPKKKEEVYILWRCYK